jgi:hypothetical protein
MSNYFIPRYNFVVIDYSANYTIPPAEAQPKYLFIEVEDRNKDCDGQIYSFFMSLKNVYIFKESLSLIIGNDIKEINIFHYEKEQLDNNYRKLKELLNIPI